MIEVNNLSVIYNGEKALSNINLKIEHNGLYCIVGPSGCGKSTLLKAIAGLVNYTGHIKIDGNDYKSLHIADIDSIRAKKLGFVFQDFRLFEYDTVHENIGVSIDIKCVTTSKQKNKRIEDLLNTVGLLSKKNEIVSNLSGGEKQRVALARALSNSPKIILADEPTGNLDAVNTKKIVNILKKISGNTIVIVVTHDIQSIESCADRIIKLKDGMIEDDIFKESNHIDTRLPLISIKNREKKAYLPWFFCIKHALNNFKKRKFRTMFAFLSSSLSLIGVGLGTTIRSIISTNLVNSYSSLIPSNRIIMSSKDSFKDENIYSLSEDDFQIIKKEYHDNIKNDGVFYWNDFTNFLTDYDFSFSCNSRIRPLPLFDFSYFNEFNLIEDINRVYPAACSCPNKMYLGLNNAYINEFCFQLQIERTIESFSYFISTNEILIDISLANDYWDYNKVITFGLAGFILDDEISFYSYDNYWNEFVYENLCGFTSTNIINKNTAHPWDLKKSYYLEFTNIRDDFLKSLRFESKYKYVCGEVLTNHYYKKKCAQLDPEACNRVALLNIEHLDNIPLYHNEFYKSVSDDLQTLIYSSNYGYVIYEESLMMGFARPFYVSLSKNKIEDISELTSYIEVNDDYNKVDPKNVISGYFSKSSFNGLTFNPKYNLKNGRNPVNYKEIVVSNGLIDALGEKCEIGSYLYVAYPKDEQQLNNGYITRNYIQVPLKVVGVSDSSKIEISHNDEWSILFFQCVLGLSIFDLRVSTIAFDVSDGTEEQNIAKLQRAFPNYNYSCPVSGIKGSINEICTSIELVLFVLSLTSVFIAILQLLLSNRLYFYEVKRDIGLIRCLGICEKDSKKILYANTIAVLCISFVLASLELLFISYAMTKIFAQTLKNCKLFIINPISFLIMFGLMIFVILISGVMSSKVVNHSLDLGSLI